MLLITGIESHEIDEIDENRVVVNTRGPLWYGDPVDYPCHYSTADVEYVKGQRYVDSTGTEHTIAMTGDVREKLGLVIEAQNGQARMLDEAQRGASWHAQRAAKWKGKWGVNETELLFLRSADFWTRFKWLFTGVT